MGKRLQGPLFHAWSELEGALWRADVPGWAVMQQLEGRWPWVPYMLSVKGSVWPLEVPCQRCLVNSSPLSAQLSLPIFHRSGWHNFLSLPENLSLLLEVMNEAGDGVLFGAAHASQNLRVIRNLWVGGHHLRDLSSVGRDPGGSMHSASISTQTSCLWLSASSPSNQESAHFEEPKEKNTTTSLWPGTEAGEALADLGECEGCRWGECPNILYLLAEFRPSHRTGNIYNFDAI